MFDTNAVEGYLEPLILEPTDVLASVAEDVKQFGKLWAPKPRSICSWSIFPREKSTFFHLFQQSGNNPAYLPICNDTFISSVNYEESHLMIKLQAIYVPGFAFTIVFPANEVRYSHETIRAHLVGKTETRLIDHIVSNLLNLSSPKKFVQTYQQYTSNIWSVLADHEASKAKGKAPARRVAAAALEEGSGSGTARSGMASLEATPTQTRKRPNPNPSSSGAKKKSKSNSGGSAITYMNPTMKHATCERDIDYEAASKTQGFLGEVRALLRSWQGVGACACINRSA